MGISPYLRFDLATGKKDVVLDGDRFRGSDIARYPI